MITNTELISYRFLLWLVHAHDSRHLFRQRRRLLKMSLAHKYIHRKDQQQAYLARKPGKDETVKVDVTDDVLMTSHGDDGDEEAAPSPPRPALVNRRRHGKKRKR